jgi:hypothetical protein
MWTFCSNATTKEKASDDLEAFMRFTGKRFEYVDWQYKVVVNCQRQDTKQA